MCAKVFIDFHYLKNLNKGFGQYSLNLAKELAQQNPENLELNFYVPPLWTKRFGKHVNYKYYFSLHRHFNLFNKYDIFHSINYLSKIEPKNFNKTKIIYTIHDAIFSVLDRPHVDTSKNYENLQNKIDRSACLVYISEFTKTSIQKNFKIPSHVMQYVVYNGNPFDGIPPVETKSYKFHYLLSVGEFRGYKNHKSLIPMLQFLDKELKLIFIGKPHKETKESIMKLAKKHQVENRVIIKGIVSEKEKIELYSNATALVHPSLAEGFGLPVVEAMSFGVPVIISDNTSLPEVGGAIAHYWQHYDAEYMAQIVMNAIEDFNTNASQKSDALKKQAKKFSWQTAAKQYIDIYKEIN